MIQFLKLFLQLFKSSRESGGDGSRVASEQAPAVEMPEFIFRQQFMAFIHNLIKLTREHSQLLTRTFADGSDPLGGSFLSGCQSL